MARVTITPDPFNPLSDPTANQHRMVTYRDPVTGHARLIFGDDEGVFTAVDRGDGTLVFFAPVTTGSDPTFSVFMIAAASAAFMSESIVCGFSVIACRTRIDMGVPPGSDRASLCRSLFTLGLRSVRPAGTQEWAGRSRRQ